MEYKLFGVKFRLEVVLICLVLGIIIGANLFCGFSMRHYIEGMSDAGAEAGRQQRAATAENRQASGATPNANFCKIPRNKNDPKCKA